LEIHVSENRIEKRNIIIEPPSGITAAELQRVEVVLPVIEVIVDGGLRGSAPLRSVPIVIWVVLFLLVVGNGGWMYLVWQEKRKSVKKKMPVRIPKKQTSRQTAKRKTITKKRPVKKTPKKTVKKVPKRKGSRKKKTS